jgi:hypothetical protein
MTRLLRRASKQIQVSVSISAIAILMVFAAGMATAAPSHTAEMETHFLALINEARANPLAAAARIGLNPDLVLAQLPAMRDVLISGMAPLESDAILSATARTHSNDAGHHIERNILNPLYREVGIGLVQGTSVHHPNYISMLVGDFGTRAETDAWPYLKGRVYIDLDDNHLFSPGEGISEAAVRIVGPGIDAQLLTNPAGGFALALPPAVTFPVQAAVGNYVSEQIVYTGPQVENQSIDFLIPAESAPVE